VCSYSADQLAEWDRLKTVPGANLSPHPFGPENQGSAHFCPFNGHFGPDFNDEVLTGQ